MQFAVAFFSGNRFMLDGEGIVMIYVEIEVDVNGSLGEKDNMTIYVFELEAIPRSDNPESEECIGAYVLCFVKSTNIKSALKKATEYVSNEGWEVIGVEDQFIGSRDMYEGENEDKEIRECFDEAVEYGVSGIFYTFASEDDDELDIFH